MIKISLLLLFSFFLFIVPDAKAKAFLCVPEKSTGFSYDESKDDWKITRFKTNDKYIISRNENANGEPFPERCRWCDDDYYHHLWMVRKIGVDNHVLAWCRDGYDTATGDRRPDGFTGRTGKNDDYLVCDKSGDDFKFRFSKKNMRFMFVGTRGYWDEGHIDIEAKNSTPFMEIGKCSSIE